jgi:hypothetical protein
MGGPNGSNRNYAVHEKGEKRVNKVCGRTEWTESSSRQISLGGSTISIPVF